jgi:hypothetical protein
MKRAEVEADAGVAEEAVSAEVAVALMCGGELGLLKRLRSELADQWRLKFVLKQALRVKWWEGVVERRRVARVALALAQLQWRR